MPTNPLSAITTPSAGRRTWLSVLGVILLPLVLVGAVVGSVWQSGSRADTVQAAVVNLDEPVTLNGQYVPLGRQLAGKLSSLKSIPATGEGKESSNYNWTVTNTEDAEEGLRSGKYTAVVTIPENFSKAATSTAGEASEAEQAVIDVAVSPRAGAAEPTMARTVVQTAIDTLNTELTETYLDNVFVGFTEMGKQFATVADASGKLADGTHELANGLGEVNKGTAELAKGLEQLDSNGSTLSSGVKQYTGGVTSLAEGLQQLESGTAALPAQTQQLATGMSQTATGAQKLASGAGELSKGAGQLSTGVTQTGAGAKQLATGANGVHQGLVGYAAGLEQLTKPTPETGGLPAGCAMMAQQDPEFGVADGPKCAGYVAGIQSAIAALETEQNGVTLTGAAEQTAKGATQLSAGVNGTKGQPGLAQGAEQLAGGTSELAVGAEGLATGTKQLATGTEQLSAGMSQLSKGIGSAASGAQELATAGPALASGVEQYTSGVHQVASGTTELSEGIGQLAKGAEQLDDGQRQLADGLAKGAKSVPNYSESEREQLSTVATRPVTTGATSGPVAFADPTTLASIMGIALWLGALLGSVLLGTGAARAWRSSAPTGRLLLRSLAPVAGIAAAQGLLFGGVVGWLAGQDASGVAKLIIVGGLAGLAFAAVNQALALVGGRIGRFVAVVVGILAVATSLVAALPTALAGMRPILPTTPAMDAFIAVTGPTPGFGWATATLAAWLLMGVAFTWFGLHRHRQLKVAVAPVPA